MNLLPLVIVGLTTGSVYAIAAMGLVLTYKTSGVFNFAHGAQAAVAAYLMHTLRDSVGLPWPIAATLAILVAGVLGGMLLERLARALTAAPTSARVVATVGVLIGLSGLLVVVYGAAAIPFPQFLPDALVPIAGVNVRVSQLISMALAAGAAAGLYVFFQRARLGVAMQAVVDDPDLLDLTGTNPLRVRRYAWILGSVFAAVSGILLAPVIGLDVTILTLLVVQAFGAAAIGAFDSLLRTYVGALAIGVAVAVLPSYLGPLADLAGQATFPFLVLFVALLVMPPTRLVQRGERMLRVQRRLREPAPWLRRAGLAVGAATLLVVPAVVGTDVVLYTQALGYVILFASLGLLVRTSGQVSLCHIAFAGVGAAVFARAATAGVPWGVAVLLGGLAAVPVGAVVALPAIRLVGVYLAIATFGFGILVERVLFPTDLLFGASGSLSAPRPWLGWLPFDGDTAYYYVVLAVVVTSLALVGGLRTSRLGRLLRALADSPVAMGAHGVDTRLTRLLVFVVSAFLAGLGGAVIAPASGSATSFTFSFFTSLTLLAVLAIAGRRPLVSPFVAAFLLVVAPSFSEGPVVAEWSPVIFGMLAVMAAVVAGRGRSRSLKKVSGRDRERQGMRPRRPALGAGVAT